MYLVLAIGFSIAFVSAAFAMSSDILDDIMSSGTETYSRYLTGFLKFIPLTLIAILMFSSPP
ncbi:putative membrane protein [Streptococcus pneumoniae GA13723]|nr:putative membrane protein [Streptococcus pneumoniae GA13723]